MTGLGGIGVEIEKGEQTEKNAGTSIEHNGGKIAVIIQVSVHIDAAQYVKIMFSFGVNLVLCTYQDKEVSIAVWIYTERERERERN